MRVDTGCIESPLLDLTEIDLSDLDGFPADSLARSLQHALRGVREGDGAMASHAAYPDLLLDAKRQPRAESTEIPRG